MTTQVAERYELGAVLGAGGMAEVYRARDRALERDVAIKMLRAEANGGGESRRLLREAQAAASFSHPHAVTVYDVGTWDGRPYLVLELVEGGSLADLLRSGPLPPARAVQLMCEVLAALDAAHRHGLVHRDVKPANVLLTREGGTKLSDFGIVKGMADPSATVTADGAVLGTPRYLSPEQISGGPITARSDVYMAGVVLYELLAGAPPFAYEKPLAAALAHQHETPPPLRRRRPEVDRRLARAVHRALAKRPEDRFSDAATFAATLAAAGARRPRARAAAGVSAGATASTLAARAGSPLAAPAGSPLAAPAGSPLAAPAGLPLTRPPRGRGGGPSAATNPAPAPRRAHATRRETGQVGAQRSAGGRRVRPGLLALVITAAVLALAGLWRFGAASGNGEAIDGSPASTEAVTEQAPTAEASGPAEAALGQPSDLGELMAALAERPEAFGPRASELLDRLVAMVNAEDGAARARSAAELLADVQDWAAAGALDPAVASATTALLRPLTQQVAESEPAKEDAAQQQQPAQPAASGEPPPKVDEDRADGPEPGAQRDRGPPAHAQGEGRAGRPGP